MSYEDFGCVNGRPIIGFQRGRGGWSSGRIHGSSITNDRLTSFGNGRGGFSAAASNDPPSSSGRGRDFSSTNSGIPSFSSRLNRESTAIPPFGSGRGRGFASSTFSNESTAVNKSNNIPPFGNGRDRGFSSSTFNNKSTTVDKNNNIPSFGSGRGLSFTLNTESTAVNKNNNVLHFGNGRHRGLPFFSSKNRSSSANRGRGLSSTTADLPPFGSGRGCGSLATRDNLLPFGRVRGRGFTATTSNNVHNDESATVESNKLPPFGSGRGRDFSIHIASINSSYIGRSRDLSSEFCDNVSPFGSGRGFSSTCSNVQMGKSAMTANNNLPPFSNIRGLSTASSNHRPSSSGRGFSSTFSTASNLPPFGSGRGCGSSSRVNGHSANNEFPEDEYAKFGLGSEPADYLLSCRTLQDVFAEDHRNAERYQMVADDDEDIALNEDNKDVSVAFHSSSLATIDTWKDAKFELQIYANLAEANYVRPRKIQAHSIPVIMEGYDLKAHAETGSGKTIAFMAPIINMLMKSPDPRKNLSCPAPLALIIEPARELCLQVYDQGRKIANGTGITVAFAYGEYPYDKNYSKLQAGCDVLCATPGRLINMVSGFKGLSLAHVKYLVLDEADRLLDGNFMPQLRRIITSSEFPGKNARQTMLFSATFPEEVQLLSRDVLKANNIFLSLKNRSTIAANSKIAQCFLLVEQNEKKNLLLEILKGTTTLEVPTNVERTLIFVNSRRSADLLAIYLSEEGLKATTINADRSQKQRECALAMFRDLEVKVLVSTDVCARGIDVKEMDHVINFDLPNDPVVYVHRIGRTGRLRGGFATSFFDEHCDKALAPHLIEIMRDAGQDPPDFLKEIVNVVNHPRADDAISMWNRPSYCGFVTNSLVKKATQDGEKSLNKTKMSKENLDVGFGTTGFQPMETILDNEWLDDTSVLA